MLGALVACSPIYGANFGYPDEVPVAESAAVLATDTGQDDDDPVRSRQQVIDVQDGSLPAVLDFYRQAFATAEGWTSVKTGSEQELCLVNQSDDRYTELLEVFPYSGDRVEARQGRYLVMISRLEPDFGKEPCGEATSWVSTDLLPLHPNFVVK
jgi:hypothetical protein